MFDSLLITASAVLYGISAILIIVTLVIITRIRKRQRSGKRASKVVPSSAEIFSRPVDRIIQELTQLQHGQQTIIRGQSVATGKLDTITALLKDTSVRTGMIYRMPAQNPWDPINEPGIIQMGHAGLRRAENALEEITVTSESTLNG